MEQFIRGFDTNGENQANANFAADLASGMNGQTETTSIASYERNGGSYALRAIADTTRKSSDLTKHGIRDLREDNRGWIRRVYLKPLGTRALRAARKFHAGIAGQNSIRPNKARGFALNPVQWQETRERAYRRLIYLIEQGFIDPKTLSL